jgi:hypothetical protein
MPPGAATPQQPHQFWREHGIVKDGSQSSNSSLHGANAPHEFSSLCQKFP